MAEHPTLPPKAAVLLDTIADYRQRDSTYPTTGCSGCDIGQHLHWPCTNPHGMGDYRALGPIRNSQSFTPTPEHDWKPDRRRSEDPESGTGTGRAQTDLHTRTVEKLAGDPVTEYLANTPDPDDSEWTPT
jgi:hypothetical protein